MTDLTPESEALLDSVHGHQRDRWYDEDRAALAAIEAAAARRAADACRDVEAERDMAEAAYDDLRQLWTEEQLAEALMSAGFVRRGMNELAHYQARAILAAMEEPA